jgi:hypothetical protein
MIWLVQGQRDHQDSYTNFIKFHVGAHGYHRLRTALGAYTRSCNILHSVGLVHLYFLYIGT